ncbi:MAG: anhydro-N-acetylmuramic acid kinase [Candidatus Baltobacteraceae bacterium]
MLAIGLMSGTSLDGVDAALVRIVPRGPTYAIELLGFESQPFAPDLRAALIESLPPRDGSVAGVARLHHALGGAYAGIARIVARGSTVDFAASHGQTLWHDGPHRVTLQVGDAFVIREALDATVCYDFRSADCAAGGQGAPLVALVDALILGGAGEDRVALNLGGIANVTLMRKGAPPEEAIGFDTGPANMLLDAFVSQRTRGEHAFDPGGAFAAAGRADRALLAALLDDEYFAAPAPKTSGRERFGRHYLERHGDALARISLEDGAATLAALTAETVAQAIEREGFSGAHVIVSGGGARNDALLARIAERLAPARVETSDAMGIPSKAKEAIAFAVLGYETLRGRPGNVPAVTGAAHPAVLGAIAPHRLAELLTAIERECTAS